MGEEARGLTRAADLKRPLSTVAVNAALEKHSLAPPQLTPEKFNRVDSQFGS